MAITTWSMVATRQDNPLKCLCSPPLPTGGQMPMILGTAAVLLALAVVAGLVVGRRTPRARARRSGVASGPRPRLRVVEPDEPPTRRGQS